MKRLWQTFNFPVDSPGVIRSIRYTEYLVHIIHMHIIQMMCIHARHHTTHLAYQVRLVIHVLLGVAAAQTKVHESSGGLHDNTMIASMLFALRPFREPSGVIVVVRK